MNEDEDRVQKIRSNALAEKTLTSELDSALSHTRTPHMKQQLTQVLQNVQAAEMLLRFAKNAEQRTRSDAWLSLAESNIRAATDIRLHIQKLIDIYGGPQSVQEEQGGPQVEGHRAA
jgi:hypothetical protein